MSNLAWKILLLVLGIVSPVFSAMGGGRVLDSSDEAFLRDQAQRIVASAGMRPGQCVGKWCNTSHYAIHVPGGNMGYTAFWVRDSVMMLGADLISAPEVEDWIHLISSTLRGPKDWQVHPGAVVPAFAVPDHINFDGQGSFYPGNYETGAKMGGYPFGKYPPLDDDFYFITAIYQHWKMTGSRRLFNTNVKTSFGEMRLSDVAEKVYRRSPVDSLTGLLVAGDTKTENAKDWGFCDGEFKSGKLLFPSVLKFIAANQLAELFSASGQAAKARSYKSDAAQIKRAIPAVFYRAAPNPGEGWLHSATEVGNQPDVWGSAFTLWSGAVDGAVAEKVGRALVRAFREKTAVSQGCVRQILTTDPTNHGLWQSALHQENGYQNGGYWGTPTGWYITAIDKVDPRAAADMARDYVGFLRNNLRPDGTAQAWEWSIPGTDRHSNPLYGATVALPYASLKEAGLLGTTPATAAHAKD